MMDKKHYAKLWLDVTAVMEQLYSDSSLHYCDKEDTMMNMQWVIAHRFCPKRILNNGECSQDSIKEYAISLLGVR